MLCSSCQKEARSYGKTSSGNQRFFCPSCRRTFSAPRQSFLGDMRIPLDRAIQALRMLLEGNSIRSTERLTSVNRNTIMDLLVLVGERCERFLSSAIWNVPASNVQVDELWGFVFCKEKTARRKGYPSEGVGDCWCFIGIERDTKLVLAWQVGKRDYPTALDFAHKLRKAASGNFQLTTDGLAVYPRVMAQAFGPTLDFAQLVKIYGVPADERRYSPMEVIDTIIQRVSGEPKNSEICTSHIERQNRTLRMQIRRLTRLTDAHSKKWENHEAAMALFFAYYNFCRVHLTLKTTPAVQSGLTDHVWSVRELIEKLAKHN